MEKQQPYKASVILRTKTPKLYSKATTQGHKLIEPTEP